MLLRVPQFRGAQVAAGVVVLTVLAMLLELRMTWSDGAHLAATGGLAVFVWMLVIATPPAEGRARPWLASLCLSAVLLLIVALGHVGQTLGASGYYSGSGTAFWAGLVVCASASWCARARGAASCALVAGTSGVVTVVAFADLVGDPSSAFIRWLLLLCAFVLLVLTIATRDSRPEHAAQFANAGGLTVSVIGLETLVTSLFDSVFSGLGDIGDGAGGGLYAQVNGLGTGWEIVLATAGFGLMAYGAVDGMRGPVVVGLLDIALFTGSVTFPRGDFLWWPLVLLLGGLVFVVIGLRPTTPAPPEPGYDIEPLPPIDVRRP